VVFVKRLWSEVWLGVTAIDSLVGDIVYSEIISKDEIILGKTSSI
jgi:hypothetical protein